MVRDTSAIAFAELQYSGTLGELQAKAFRLIKENPGKTANELRILEQNSRPGADHEYYESLDKRFSELERWGVIVSKDKRPCEVSKKLCYTWWVTGSEPIKPPKRVGKPDQKRLVEKLLNDIKWHIKNNVPIDVAQLELQGQQIIQGIFGGNK